MEVRSIHLTEITSAIFNTTPMSATVFADEHYKQKDFLSETLSPGTYDNCQFTSCQFTGLDLSGFRFTECQFED